MKKSFSLILVLCASMGLSVLPSMANAKQHLQFGSSTVGGSAYVLAAAWSKLITAHMPDVEVSVEVTGGADSNITLVQEKEMDIATSTTWQAGLRYAGKTKSGAQAPDIRCLLPTYASYLQAYCLADKPITKFSDLAGKRVASASAGSGSYLATQAILKALDIKIAKQNGLTASAISDSLRDGLSDAAFTMTGLPGPFMLELESTHEARLISLTEEEMKTILQKEPYWAEGIIPKGTYKCVTEDVRAVAFWNMVIANKDMDEKLAYDLTKLSMESLSSLGQTVRDVLTTTPKDVLVSPIPLHKGALKYFREVGIDIPDRLIPPEAK